MSSKSTLILFMLLIVLSHSYGDDHLLDKKDTNLSLRSIDIVASDKIKLRKKSKSMYRKFKDIFSDYDGPWIEDMIIYSADIMMPDEMIRAAKDVVDNRKDKDFDSQAKHIPKMLGNDAYNIMLTSAYYYMQDISRISKASWEDDVCDPDMFIYQTEREPQKPLLDLKANDENARGVSKHGVVLPVNDNFPNALYPYAAKPDGCSAEGLQKLYNQANDLSDDDKWLSLACDAHDRCYYTLGTSAKKCNEKFIIDSIDSCNSISGRDTLLYMGSKNAFCGFKAFAVSTGANSCAQKYFDQAQREQMIYEQWIERYEKEYNKAKKK